MYYISKWWYYNVIELIYKIKLFIKNKVKYIKKDERITVDK